MSCVFSCLSGFAQTPENMLCVFCRSYKQLRHAASCLHSSVLQTHFWKIPTWEMATQKKKKRGWLGNLKGECERWNVSYKCLMKCKISLSLLNNSSDLTLTSSWAKKKLHSFHSLQVKLDANPPHTPAPPHPLRLQRRLHTGDIQMSWIYGAS